MNENNDIKKAHEELKQVSGDYELRRIAELKEKYIRDEAAALEYAIEKGQKEGVEKGIQQGIEQGKNEAKKEVAKNMLKLGIELDIISKTTGLTKEEILKA